MTTTRTPDRSKTPGVCYAVTDDGIELPVVDITHPAFRCEPSAAEIATVTARSRRGLERSAKLPSLVLRLLARRSVILRDMLGNRGYVSGMTTYLFKLGPDRLPRCFGRIDRQMVSAIGPLSCRLRLREMALQLADALAPLLTRPGSPLRLLNLAGGVAADALNALILLKKANPASLAGRAIAISVLDPDRESPAFGARACAALCRDGQPLAGLSLTFAHTFYDWADPTSLADALSDLPKDALAVGCSEGGLFEYADDTTVIANLDTLRGHTTADFVLVGSLVRDDNLAWLTRGAGRPSLRPRNLASFEALVRRAGWVVARSNSNPMYHVVTLAQA